MWPFRRLGAAHVVELVDGRHADEFRPHVQSHLLHRAGDPGPVLGLQAVGIDRTVVQVAPVVVLAHEHEPPRLRMAFRLGRRTYLLVREGPLLDGLLSTFGEYDAAGFHVFIPLCGEACTKPEPTPARDSTDLTRRAQGIPRIFNGLLTGKQQRRPGGTFGNRHVRKLCLAPNRSFSPPTPPFPLPLRHSRSPSVIPAKAGIQVGQGGACNSWLVLPARLLYGFEIASYAPLRARNSLGGNTSCK